MVCFPLENDVSIEIWWLTIRRSLFCVHTTTFTSDRWILYEGSVCPSTIPRYQGQMVRISCAHCWLHSTSILIRQPLTLTMIHVIHFCLLIARTRTRYEIETQKTEIHLTERQQTHLWNRLIPLNFTALCLLELGGRMRIEQGKKVFRREGGTFPAFHRTCMPIIRLIMISMTYVCACLICLRRCLC